MSLLRNISLSRKLLLILLLPMVGFLWLAGLFVAERIQTLKMMDQTVRASVVTEQISQLVSNLQRERGASGVYLRSRGNTMQERLPVMRADTDTAVAILRQAGTASDTLLAELMSNLDSLQGLRTEIDRMAITNLESGSR